MTKPKACPFIKGQWLGQLRGILKKLRALGQQDAPHGTWQQAGLSTAPGKESVFSTGLPPRRPWGCLHRPGLAADRATTAHVLLFVVPESHVLEAGRSPTLGEVGEGLEPRPHWTRCRSSSNSSRAAARTRTAPHLQALRISPNNCHVLSTARAVTYPLTESPDKMQAAIKD